MVAICLMSGTATDVIIALGEAPGSEADTLTKPELGARQRPGGTYTRTARLVNKRDRHQQQCRNGLRMQNFEIIVGQPAARFRLPCRPLSRLALASPAFSTVCPHGGARFQAELAVHHHLHPFQAAAGMALSSPWVSTPSQAALDLRSLVGLTT